MLDPVALDALTTQARQAMDRALLDLADALQHQREVQARRTQTHQAQQRTQVQRQADLRQGLPAALLHNQALYEQGLLTQDAQDAEHETAAQAKVQNAQATYQQALVVLRSYEVLARRQANTMAQQARRTEQRQMDELAQRPRRPTW